MTTCKKYQLNQKEMNSDEIMQWINNTDLRTSLLYPNIEEESEMISHQIKKEQYSDKREIYSDQSMMQDSSYFCTDSESEEEKPSNDQKSGMKFIIQNILIYA